jgi:hypothetical protein
VRSERENLLIYMLDLDEMKDAGMHARLSTSTPGSYADPEWGASTIT